MSELALFIPITKVDARERLVYGIATAECEDRTGEICDYASTKPHYEKWSEEISESSGGKSLGNLRAMHGSVAAGKITALAFNDDAKQIEVCAKVVDDAEWRKVEEGVYTGFSQGGTYVRRWTDENGCARYTAAPSEISLVDLPCLPQARFEMIKADGSRVFRRFGKGLVLVSQFADLVDDLNDLQSAAAVEAAKEGDGDLSQQRDRIAGDLSQQRDRIAGDLSQQRDRIAGDLSQQRDRIAGDLSQQRDRIAGDLSQQRDRIAGDLSQQRDRIAGDLSQQRDRNAIAYDLITDVPIALGPEDYVHPYPLTDVCEEPGPQWTKQWGPFAWHACPLYLRALEKLEGLPFSGPVDVSLGPAGVDLNMPIH